LADPGGLDVAGDVVGPDGELVSSAVVYVLEKGQRGTLRSTRTDANGRFRLDSLPDRLRTAPWRLQADRLPEYAPAVLEFQGEPARGEVRITLPNRLVRVEVVVRDAASGEPLRRAVARLLNPGDPRRSDVPLRFDEQLSVYEGIASRGPQELVVETLEGGPRNQRVDVVPGADGAWRTEVRMPGAIPEPIDVRLEVLLTDAVTGAPLTRANVEVLVRGEPVSRLEAERRDGRYVLPAPSVRSMLRVMADGYEPIEQSLALDATQPEIARSLALRPR
jgi:hypothetical protein